MQGLVTVFGGTGFVGRQVVRALARKGLRVRAAARNPGQGYRLRMLGDVGQIEVVQANVRDAESVARALDGAEGCINLVGVMHESGPQKFQSVHIDAARQVAEAAKAAGASRFVQISAVGADANSPSAYARSRAQGEEAVKAAFPGATVIRSSIVFGPEDDFFNRFGRMAALTPLVLPVVGENTKVQPIFVGDLGDAIANAIVDPATQATTFEVGGPRAYTFREIMQQILDVTGRKRTLVPLPFGVAGLIGAVGGLTAVVGIKPMLTSDQVELLKIDNVPAEGAPGLRELGVEPTTVEAVIPTYLYRYRRGGQYADLAAAA